LQVSLNTYGADDLAFFAVNDVVDFLPHGDEDNATIGLTISAISASGLITFSAAHGITAGTDIGTIEPTSYTSASSAHQNDAYLADASGTLGSSTPAQEYA
jgi:hypothetical protein